MAPVTYKSKTCATSYKKAKTSANNNSEADDNSLSNSRLDIFTILYNSKGKLIKGEHRKITSGHRNFRSARYVLYDLKDPQDLFSTKGAFREFRQYDVYYLYINPALFDVVNDIPKINVVLDDLTVSELFDHSTPTLHGNGMLRARRTPKGLAAKI
ncbi:MAG: hypothetical protein LQ350_004608 [Teloschistes chrysophthalmus]|nr:MAG: hypothetical protein LQ350_004608 [Niorma chrysophthalma]